MMNRPPLNNKISLKDFQEFYWLKEELVVFCKANGIISRGNKLEISTRILKYLEFGITDCNQTVPKVKSRSKFDWNNSVLSLLTIITDNYKNTENVRRFFVSEIGTHFHFTVDFMKWIRENNGKTMSDAICQWNHLYELKKDKTHKSTIAPQFEYNRYIRAFMNDNPDKSIKDAIQCWKIKKTMRGHNEYSKSDLGLISIE